MPFISTKLYTGPMVAHLGGVDISWIIGLVVPSVLYYLVARRSNRPVPARMVLPAEPMNLDKAPNGA
ncbi:hypothetical protein D3C81_2191240 [compost metagenome]